ncbi:hypothetical protein JG559_07635 [Enterococcus faecalis]|uniref:Uncharacterized protein n=1 Tax=Enterococcus faecalis TaxID=1351 RepID=A0A974NZB9_ENTFL|nr:hypothetical protein JG559_07635 [Enterococcus faecalis]
MEKLCQYQINLSIIHLHESKTALLEKQINPALYPNKLYGNRSWDTFYRYDNQLVYESSYY